MRALVALRERILALVAGRRSLTSCRNAEEACEDAEEKLAQDGCRNAEES